MIKLTKDRIIRTNDFEPDEERYKEWEVPHLIPYLNNVVALSDDFTLGDLFRWIEKEKTYFDMLFDSQLGHYDLQLYIDDMKRSVENKKEEEEIEYLEVSRGAERWDFNNSIDIFLGFHGIGKKDEHGITSYAVEFTPLNELKDLPLKINNHFELGETVTPPQGRAYYKKHVEGDVDITLYELISAVLDEISFCGTPEMRDGKLKEIVGRAEEVEKEYKEHPEKFRKFDISED